MRVGTQHQWLSLSELSNILQSGARLVFSTVVLSERILDPYVRDLPTANMFACIAIRTGTFNDAELIDGAPRLPKSLIGVVHRTLVNDGHNPTWHIHGGTYRSLFEVGDFLEVTV